MLFQGIFTLLILIGGFWCVWKFLISPRIEDEPQEAQHTKILKKKLEELQDMKQEYEDVKMERDVTSQLKELDDEIEKCIKDIKSIEND